MGARRAVMEDINKGDWSCQECKGLNPLWWAPSDVWNLVMGGPGAKDDPGGVLCPTCFMHKAFKAGVRVVWSVRPESEVCDYHEDDAYDKSVEESVGSVE